ncbi:MAG: NUDIX domain-containing protein [Flavobacteriales bacterium]
MKYKVIQTRMAHDGFLPIEEGTIVMENEEGKKYTYMRERVLRRDAAAVLLFNSDTRMITLTRQFRFAVHGKTNGFLTEIAAGKVDHHENEELTAIRETLEECGIEIKTSDLVKLSSFFASPGYTAEKYHLFFVSHTNKQKINKGGGLAAEHEYIEVVEVPVDEFYRQVMNDEIPDAKTIMAALLAKQKGLIT